MANWTPSLNALRAFEAVARHRSYKDAAHELNVTPAAVKQLVVKLETALGAPLIERQGNRLIVTPQGKKGQPDLERALHHMSQAVRKLRRPPSGTRLIATVETSIATAWLVPKLEAFRAAFPGIDVLIDSSQTILDLEREDVDVAIRYGVAPQENLITHRLFEDLIVPACSPGLAESIADAHPDPHLKDYPLIHWDLSQIPWATETMKWHGWDTWLAQAGVSGVNTATGPRFSDYGMAVQASISGQGMILAGLPVVHDQLDAGLLVCPYPDLKVTTDIGYDLVTTQTAYTKPGVRSFCEWVLEISSWYRGAFETLVAKNG